MTDQPPQPPMPNVPPQPEQPPAAPAQAERKRLSNKVVIGAAAAVIAAIIGTGIVVVQTVNNDDDKPATTTGASTDPTEGVATATVDEPAPEPSYATPVPDDFTMTLRTTSRQCFGSAGCNVTVEPSLAYMSLAELDPDATYEITYEIKGDESGPVIETAELSDKTTLNYTPTSITTASSSTKVSVKITDIRTQGI
ncbi:hypothetical protein ABTX99_28540 [Streptomyces flaveolus]|uniref:hypothetical protein n=1 Tax=Streptomyces flaveolus TaxID=67297 RepID=UPI0033274BB6